MKQKVPFTESLHHFIFISCFRKLLINFVRNEQKKDRWTSNNCFNSSARTIFFFCTSHHILFTKQRVPFLFQRLYNNPLFSNSIPFIQFPVINVTNRFTASDDQNRETDQRASYELHRTHDVIEVQVGEDGRQGNGARVEDIADDSGASCVVGFQFLTGADARDATQVGDRAEHHSRGK